MDENSSFSSEPEKILSKKKIVWFTVLTYFILYVISFLLLVLLIRLPLFNGMKVLMYRGILMIVLSGAAVSGIMALVRKYKKISWLSLKDIVLVFLFTVCVNMVFFTLVPVTVERSVSVFMLSYMDTYSERTYTEEEIAEIFKDKYVEEYGAFEKRFDEQQRTGTIEQNEDGSYSITGKGSFIVGLFRFISGLFGTDKRLVYP